jgi:HPt (histidine-containing phosphotransfer) domain-containing protein
MLQVVTENMSSFAELLRQHRAVYLASLPARLAQLDALAHQLADPQQTAATLPALERCAHALAGSAGTFGLHALGDTARALELVTVEAMEGTAIAPQVSDGLAALRSQLQQVVADSGREVEP